MKKLLLALTVVAVTALFPSCVEEVPDPPPDNEDDTTYSTRNYLAKTVYTTADTVGTTTYRYDAGNKLIWFANTWNKAGNLQDTSELTRSAQGAINKITYRSNIYNNRKDAVDSRVVLQDVYLDAASKYTHKIVQYTASGAPFKDSIIYAYDAQSRINKESAYYYDFVGKKYVLYGATDFTYTSNGDVTSRKIVFNNIGGTANNYEYTFTYTYDDKVNALNLGNEAIILGIGENWSAHNPKTIVVNYPAPDNKFNQSLTYTYKYNTVGRPLTAEITDALSSTKTTIVYTYQ